MGQLDRAHLSPQAIGIGRRRRCTANVLTGALVLGLAAGCGGPSTELRDGRVGAVEDGKASYYAAHLAGHRTASGERYNPAALTAAHPVLPFGVFVRVTRVDDDHASVVVRINDRCAGGRKIIDLSQAAARALGMLRAGVVAVHVQVVSRAEASTTKEPKGPKGPKGQ